MPVTSHSSSSKQQAAPASGSRWACLLLAACWLFASGSRVMAETTFGIYDARTLAMGGASVASANNGNAQFYNAALLAFNEEIEERTQDSRFLFPVLVPQVAESALDIEELATNDPNVAITRDINAFNAAPGPVTAQAVVDSTASLEAALDELDDEDLFADVYIGLAISEPGKLQGAGFFLGSRLLAGGRTFITDTDRAVLDAYQEGLTFVASGGTRGAARPELFDANGALIDPANDFDSSAAAVGAVVTEAGVAMSSQFEVFGRSLAAGLSIKIQRIRLFEDTAEVVDDRIDTDQNREDHGMVNLDIGLAKDLGRGWRLGLAVKDLVPRNYETSFGTIIRLRPRPRIGAAWQRGPLQLALDADLTRNEPLGVEQATREAALGAELSLHDWLSVRAGYRHDLEGNRDGVASAGVGTLWKRLAVDLAYAEGDDARAAALQFGVAF